MANPGGSNRFHVPYRFATQPAFRKMDTEFLRELDLDFQHLATLLQTNAASSQINEQPAGPTNGVNVYFTLSHVPAQPNAVALYLNGQRLINGVDYTVGGPNNRTITMVTWVPVQNDVLLADYTI